MIQVRSVSVNVFEVVYKNIAKIKKTFTSIPRFILNELKFFQVYDRYQSIKGEIENEQEAINIILQNY